MSKVKASNLANKVQSKRGRNVLSDDCIKCTEKCSKGIKYLERFAVKHEGIGVHCNL